MICRLIIYLSICLFLVTLLNPHSILHHICIWLMLSSKAAKTEGTSRIHFQNFPRAICHCSAQHVNFSCTQVRGFFIQFLAVTERETVISSPSSQSPEVPAWFFVRCRVLHEWIRSAGWAVLQAHCGSSGIRAVGVEDGNPGLSVAELLNYSRPPTLPASIPLCSASTETSITVWMSDLCLSPSLNLKWGALPWILQQFLRKQLQDIAVTISWDITVAEIGLKLHFEKKR